MKLLQRIKLFTRSIKRAYQKLTRGFSDADLWSLDYTIAKFVLPRLKAFREMNGAYPGTEPMGTDEKWDAALDEMIWAMQFVVDDFKCDAEINSENYDRCQKGLELFGRWFCSLWY
jgi:hypothetical protein